MVEESQAEKVPPILVMATRFRGHQGFSSGGSEPSLDGFQRCLATDTQHCSRACLQAIQADLVGAKETDPEFAVIYALNGRLDFVYELLISITNGVNKFLIAMTGSYVRCVHGVFVPGVRKH